METVGSTRLGRASSRYGAPAVFNGPVRKWEKKWVHVSSSSFNNNKKNNKDNSNEKSRLLLRRWTPVANSSSAEDVSDEPPRRKFRYTPIAALEEQKKGAVKKVEHESTIESDQVTARQTNLNHEVHGKLNMNEVSEDTKDSNMNELDLGFDFQGNNGENSQK